MVDQNDRNAGQTQHSAHGGGHIGGAGEGTGAARSTESRPRMWVNDKREYTVTYSNTAPIGYPTLVTDRAQIISLLSASPTELVYGDFADILTG